MKLSHFLCAGIVAASMSMSTEANAEVLMNETFSYPAGNLYGNGGWLQSNNKENPIQVTATTLSLDGYATGNSVQLKPVSSQDQDCQVPFVPQNGDGKYTAITDKPVYTAMLINVKEVTDVVYFAAFSTVNSSFIIKDGSSFTGPYGCVFVSPSANEGKYNIGIGKGSSKPTAKSDKDLDYGTTYVIVTKYTPIEGTTNDTFECWVNPVAGSAESAAELSAETNAGDPSRGLATFAIAQATGSVKKCPDMLVGTVRVATSWADLWSSEQGGGDTPATEQITAAMPNLGESFALYQYQKYDVTVNVKAAEITEDITVTGYTNAKPSVTTIPAADACGPQGFDLTLTLDATAGAPIAETITLTSGETKATVPVNINVIPVKTLSNFRNISTMQEYETYYFSGNATVTHVDAANSKIYLQDILSGMALGYSYTGLDTAPFKKGDKVSGLYILATEPALGVPGCELMAYYTPSGIGFGTITDTDVDKQPLEVSLADFSADPASYFNILIKLKDVTFTAAGQKFGTGGTEIKSGDATAKVRVFAGTDIFGTDIPESAVSVTGISTSPSTAMLTMRSLADLVATPAGEETLEVTGQMLAEAGEYYPVNVATPFAKFTVKAQNLAKAATIYITGVNRDQFSADIDQIPAGTGEYVITVTFKPTKTGTLKANLMIDTSNTELAFNSTITGLAYDPDNLPEFSVDASAVTDFTAKVGERHEQTITINAKGLLEYGAVKVLGQGQGAFIINSAMFLKDGNTQLKVTFAPRAEGTFTEVIEFSAVKAETVTVTVKGSTDGGQKPSEKEGDELVFDTASPLTYYSTDFTGAGDKNKPLAIAGWKNVAVDGNRAWWSYADTDGNACAKVTSYVFGGATADEPVAEMLLLSPALDYKNCTSRLLSFRIKGEMLSDTQAGQLTVLYIDPELPEDERYQALLSGSDIPMGEAASGEWVEYVIDLEGLDLADTFFIGFHYLSVTGATSPESYYVDDFCYGSTTQKFIRIDKRQVVAEAKVGESADMETITVTGLNLTEPIAVALEGKYKGYFTNAPAELPATGGELNFKYTPGEEGEHAVYVNLTSAGAPMSTLVIGGLSQGVSGITLPGVDSASSVSAYDLNGREVIADTAAESAFTALRGLEKGIYILRVKAADGSEKSIKYMRP